MDKMSADAGRVGPTANLWGTWEELILGSAVERHGTDDWNVIVSELRARTSHPDHSYTPEICKAKYEDLLARFSCLADLIKELRKRRMDELRRDLARSNDNISRLESQLRYLKQEKEGPGDSSANASKGIAVDNSASKDAAQINVGPASNDACSQTDNIMEIFNSILKSEPASVFKHRMRSQKCARYNELIKQHVDMASIRSRIMEETIKSEQELFRDLLLLVNNALVFYSHQTREYKSALSLRSLVTSEYKKRYCGMRSWNKDFKQRRSARLHARPRQAPLRSNTGSDVSFSDDDEDAQTSEDVGHDDSDKDFVPGSSSLSLKANKIKGPKKRRRTA